MESAAGEDYVHQTRLIISNHKTQSVYKSIKNNCLKDAQSHQSHQSHQITINLTKIQSPSSLLPQIQGGLDPHLLFVAPMVPINSPQKIALCTQP
jgi:hypothetical protein